MAYVAPALIDRLRPLDRRLLGIEPDPEDPAALSFEVVPHLCRTDGRFYGGAALAAALAASEAATGRVALWSCTQLVGAAALDERIRVDVSVVASGRSVDQVQVTATTGGRLVFSAVGATATPQPGGIEAEGQTMPSVASPEESRPWGGPARLDPAGARAAAFGTPPAVGHHLVSEHREAHIVDASADRPGHMALWARLTGEYAGTTMTPAVLGFLADMVPIAVCRAGGVEGAGTSLDNSLRLGEAVDTEWVLLELDAEQAVGGYGHGHVRLWSRDGRLLGTGTQSCRLFSFDDFLRRSQAGSATR